MAVLVGGVRALGRRGCPRHSLRAFGWLHGPQWVRSAHRSACRPQSRERASLTLRSVRMNERTCACLHRLLGPSRRPPRWAVVPVYRWGTGPILPHEGGSLGQGPSRLPARHGGKNLGGEPGSPRLPLTGVRGPVFPLPADSLSDSLFAWPGEGCLWDFQGCFISMVRHNNGGAQREAGGRQLPRARRKLGVRVPLALWPGGAPRTQRSVHVGPQQAGGRGNEPELGLEPRAQWVGGRC